MSTDDGMQSAASSATYPCKGGGVYKARGAVARPNFDANASASVIEEYQKQLLLLGSSLEAGERPSVPWGV